MEVRMMISLTVKTTGVAFLRNGYVNLSAIGVEFDPDCPGDDATILGRSTRGARHSPDGIGHVANGFFWVPLPALRELARQIVAAAPPEPAAVPDGADGRERRIELYVGYAGAGDGGLWDVVDVMVPAHLPEEAAVALAGRELLEIVDAQDVVFWGVYC
jgi:hypothetical protein